MNCSSVDVKAYALGEAEPRGVEAAHIESCPDCRRELDRLRLTESALLSVKEEEVPRRIAFVSDPVFEPSWWQRIWHSGPAMAFASALVLAAAIFAHGYTRPAATTGPSTDSAQIEQRVRVELNKRFDAAVTSAVAQATADSRAREAKVVEMLDAAEKRFTLQRQADVAMMQDAARYYQSKMGQLMVASNRLNEGGQ